MGFIEGGTKLIGIPLAYVFVGPVEGLMRGIRGQNYPIDYRNLDSLYERISEDKSVGPHEGRIYNHFPDDNLAEFGSIAAGLIGTTVGVVPWTAAIASRGLYELPRYVMSRRKTPESQ